MRRGRLGVALAGWAIAIVACATPALAATNNYTGVNGGSWNDGTNWSLGHVPLSTEDVTISGTNPTLSSGSDGVANSIAISSGRTLTISSSKSLTVGTGTSSLAGAVALSSGTLTLNGDTTWSAGASTISMDTSSRITINSSFEITADDSTNTDAGSLIHVSSTGVVTASNTGTANISVEFDNDGSVNVGSGTLDLGVGDNATTSGGYSIASAATLLLGSGSLQSSSPAAPMTISGSGTAAVNAGTLTVGSGDTFTPHTVDLRGNGAHFTVNKSVSLPTFTTTGANNSVTRNGSGTVTVTGSAGFAANTTFTGGTTTIAATVPSLSIGGATLAIDASVASATLTLDTPTTWNGGTNVNLSGQTATLNIASSFAITGNGQIGGSFSPLIHVTGSITTSNTGTATIQPVLDNDGTITVGSGTLDLAGGDNATTAGSYSIAGGATLLLGTGSLQSSSAAAPMTISGNGTMAVGGCCGALTVGSGDTFTPHTVDMRGDGAHFTVNKDISLPTFTTSGANNRVTRNGSGTLTVTGSAGFAANTTFSGGTTTIAATVPSLSIGGAPLTIDASVASATLNLDTPTTFSGGTNVSLFGQTATLNIASSFAITGDGQIGGPFSPLIHVTNTGSITTSNTGTATIQPVLDNDGTITVGSGTLDVAGGLTQTAGLTSVASGATVHGSVTLNGGTLKGNGTVDGSLTNTSGTVAPGSSPGTLTITGAYTQGPGATLAEEITGPTPGTQFDQLLVAGTLSLDGTLAIDSNSFTPTATDTFKIVSGASSRSGAFASVTGATVNGATYSARYDTDGVTLLVSGSSPPPPPNETLSATFAGTGAGSVSDGATLGCAASCQRQYPQGTVVTLTAAPASGSTFAGWSGGGCSGTGSCQITMSAAQSVTATFNTVPPTTHTLTVTTAGTGSGTVISSPAAISCGATCSSAYNQGTSVTLTAAAASGSAFTGWSGACSGTGPCVLNITQDLAVTATFDLLPVVVTPRVVSGATLFCGVQHRGRCSGLKIKTTFSSPGRAVWQFAAYNPSPGHITAAAAAARVVGLGRIARTITTAGTQTIVFKLPAGARTNKLHKQIVKLRLKSIRVTLTFTDTAGRSHVTTRRIRLKA